MTTVSRGTTLQPELGGIVPYRVDSIPDDPDAQVDRTIALMRDYALVSAETPELQRDLEVCRKLSDGDMLAGIHRFVHTALCFRNDEETAQALGVPHRDTMVEVLVAPVDLSRAVALGNRPAEDCDGFSMYVAALLAAAGIPCSFVTVAADDQQPNAYSHVYCAANVNGQRIPIDASHGDYAGWECPNRFGKRREWPVERQSRFAVTISIVALVAVAALFATGVQL